MHMSKYDAALIV